MAKIHNSFVDEDDAWQKIGEKSVKEAARERAEKKRKEAEEKAMSKLAADAAVYKDLNYDDLKKYASAYDKKELKKAIDFLDAKNKNDDTKKSNSESVETAKQKMIAEAVLNKRINTGYDELKKYISKLEAQKKAQEKAQEDADYEKRQKAAEEKERQAREKEAADRKTAKEKETAYKRDRVRAAYYYNHGTVNEIMANKDIFTPEELVYALAAAKRREKKP